MPCSLARAEATATKTIEAIICAAGGFLLPRVTRWSREPVVHALSLVIVTMRPRTPTATLGPEPTSSWYRVRPTRRMREPKSYTRLNIGGAVASEEEIDYRKTLEQLWLEYRWALAAASLIAIGTSLFSTAGVAPWQHVKDFFSTLAVVAYFSGNFNRVRKQQRTELEFQEARKRSDRLMTVVTGGEGQCSVLLLPPAPNGEFQTLLQTMNADPVYDLTVTAYRADSFRIGPEPGTFYTEPAVDASPLFVANVAVVHPGTPHLLPAIPVRERTPGDALYMIRIVAKNGTWVQLIHAKRYGDTVNWGHRSWISARNNSTLLAAILTPFPWGFD
jgi:hypothetical protein